MAEAKQLLSEDGKPLISAKELTGRHVRDAAGKQIGRVRSFVFHPSKPVCVGFMVKRPDAALMFHRKDVFVAFDGFGVRDGAVAIREGDGFTGSQACARLGIDLDRCVIWQGMPVIGEGGDSLGVLDDAVFRAGNGRVEWIVPHKGATADVLLGTASIPCECIVGFRFGVGDELNVVLGEDGDESQSRGAIVVDDTALSIAGEGGLAEKAGRTAAVAGEKARRAKEAAKPKVAAAAKATGRAVDKGAYATGRQLSRAKGMFAAFKSEYDKAVADGTKRTKR